MRREVVNLSTLINFDGLRDRYQRSQKLIVLDGTSSATAKVRIYGANLSDDIDSYLLEQGHTP